MHIPHRRVHRGGVRFEVPGGTRGGGFHDGGGVHGVFHGGGKRATGGPAGFVEPVSVRKPRVRFRKTDSELVLSAKFSVDVRRGGLQYGRRPSDDQPSVRGLRYDASGHGVGTSTAAFH